MRQQQPTTQTMKISEVKRRFSALVNDVYREETRVLIEKSGIPVAALVSPADLDRLVRFDREREERERDFAIIDEMRESFKDVPPEEIERESIRIVAELRAEKEAERQAKAAAIA
ncbi:MAG: type II toxin-antitoxin system Phd/YefM family antitoxin [Chloroflexota bacterium]|nr:type II toxin-antitoxin system Phd/YefM family antitoxin [Chloroflexota bacterium]